MKNAVKLIAVLSTVFFLGASVDTAEAGGGFQYWLKTISYKLKVFTSGGETDDRRTAVVGVKGTKVESSDELYWKQSDVTDEELSAFNSAVALAAEGKKDLAQADLEGFIKKYPESPFVQDAKEGLAFLKGTK